MAQLIKALVTKSDNLCPIHETEMLEGELILRLSYDLHKLWHSDVHIGTNIHV